jgi:protein SCO1/2
VSVDPRQDTRSRARRFLLAQHVTGRVRYVLGSQRELAPVWHGYGIAPQRGSLDHSSYVVLVDRRGYQRIGFPHTELTPEGLAADLRRLG